MSKTRFVFVQDESSHWYLLPLSKLKRFTWLNEQGTDEAYDAINREFEKHRTGGGIHYSFTDPKEVPK